MKKQIFLLVFSLFISLTPFAFAESIPDWVKNTAGWWATDQISQSEFINAIEFLVNEKIIDVTYTTISQNSEIVPDWVKNTAGWWATDQISQSEFINAIEFLITIGIISISSFDEKNMEFCSENDDKQISKNVKDKLCSSFFDSNYLSISRFPSSGKPVELNSYGLRGSEFNDKKTDNTFRIFVVGSSTTFGSSNDDTKTIPYLLQENFNNYSSTLDIEVINAGLASNGYSSTLSNLVKEKIINFSPDLIIVHNALNDMNNPSNSPDPAQDWHDRWSEICSLGKTNDFETIVTIQPFVGTGNKILTEDEFIIYTEFEQMDIKIKKYESFIEKLNQLKQYCTTTVDLSTAFDKIQENVFIDNVHFGDKGSKILADKFFEISVDNVEILRNLSTQKTLLQNNELEETLDYLLETNYSLSNMNFENLNLENRDFSGKNLSGSSFYNVNLRNTNFENAKLENVNLLGTNLENTNFENAILNESNIINSVLKNTNLKNADLSNSLLFHLTFVNVDMNNSKILSSRILDSDFRDTNLENTNLENTTFHMTGLSYDLDESMNIDSKNTHLYKPIMEREQFGEIINNPSKDLFLVTDFYKGNQYHDNYLQLIDDETLYNEIIISDNSQNTVVVFPETTLLASSKPCIADYYLEASSECFTVEMFDESEKNFTLPIGYQLYNHQTDFSNPHPLNYIPLYFRTNQTNEHAFSPFLFVESSNFGVQALALLGYTIISDIEIEKNPEILSNYDKVIILHNKYVTKAMFDSITNHPKVVYLYPESLTEEIMIDFSNNSLTVISPVKFPQDKNFNNDFQWKYDNSHLKYSYCGPTNDIKFEKVDNGIMLNCNPELLMTYDVLDLYKTIKDF